MTKKSDEFEHSIVQQTRKVAPHLNVEHSGANVHLPDIKIEGNNAKTYIEVKMTGAQFGTPRLKYNNGWTGVESNFITDNISKHLNADQHVNFLVSKMVEEHSSNIGDIKKPWIGYTRTHYRDQRDFYNGVPVETNNISDMIDFKTIIKTLATHNNGKIVYRNIESKPLVDMVTDYYKVKGANYIQVGDNFFAIDHNLSDDLNIKDDVPKINADANLTVRFSVRRTHQWIEIIPTIKLTNIVPSPYSLKPNTNKPSPFK